MVITSVDKVPGTIDVAVMGSGAAGLVAAVRAAEAGLSVVVLEKASLLGGTTAVGGGVMWVPANGVAEEAGYDDSEASALDYLRAATGGDVPDEHLEWYVSNGREAVEFLVSHTRVKLTALARPDYRLEWSGASHGGRSLDNHAVDVACVPGLEQVIRPSSYFPLLTMAERDALNGAAPDGELLRSRRVKGSRTMGGALVAALVLSAADRGVTIAVNARVTGLERADDGWRLRVGNRDLTATSVVVATGGFEWNAELQRAFLSHPVTPISAPSNEGDGLLLGLRLGAGVSHMTTFWGVPVLLPDGLEQHGAPRGRMGNVEMTLPGSIVVGADGKRFVNEALNYHDVSRVMGSLDASTLEVRGDPAWLVFDSRYADNYPVAGAAPSDQTKWMVHAGSLGELARLIGVDAEALAEQVAEFNAHAVAGKDPRFGRGHSAQDRFLGDQGVGPNPCLAPLTQAPFFAVRLHCGTLGTSGGLTTDEEARVLSFDGQPLPGLYAAGNVSATPFGGAYPGGGSTLGPAVIRGYVAGRSIAQRHQPQSQETPK